MAKKKKKSSVFYKFCIGCVSAISLVLTVFLLSVMFCNVPTAFAPGSSNTNLAIMDKYDRFITNEISDALTGIIAIPKEYWLSDADRVAPKPDAQSFGETDDPSQLQWLLEDAAELLDGQKTLFTCETPVKEGTAVHYYLDETIFAVTWKQIVEGAVYTFSEVKVAHPSQFRRFLAGGEYASGALYTTTEMAESVNAVVASSADYYSYRTYGTTVLDGVTYRANDSTLDICFVDENSDLQFVHRGILTNEEAVKEYVKAHNIRFSLAFGPIMIENGELCVPPVYVTGEINKYLARAALCQMGPLHYVVVTVNMEPYSVLVPTVKSFAKALLKMGVPNAYSLDGGQTATIVMNNQLINSVDYGDQRKISDIIYFATALPGGS